MHKKILDYKTISKNESNTVPFDLDDTTNYQILIEMCNDNDYLQSLGRPDIIDWDIYFLIDMMKIIIKNYQKRLTEEVINYQDINMVASFIYNAFEYALINNKESIGPLEMIKTFRDWNYLNTKLKIAILDTIFAKMHLDYKNHPYHQKPPEPKKNKNPHIIEFPEDRVIK